MAKRNGYIQNSVNHLNCHRFQNTMRKHGILSVIYERRPETSSPVDFWSNRCGSMAPLTGDIACPNESLVLKLGGFQAITVTLLSFNIAFLNCFGHYAVLP